VLRLASRPNGGSLNATAFISSEGARCRGDRECLTMNISVHRNDYEQLLHRDSSRWRLDPSDTAQRPHDLATETGAKEIDDPTTDSHTD